MDAVVFDERRECGFERTAEPAQRGGLLLRDFVIEGGDRLGGCGADRKLMTTGLAQS